MGQKYVLPSPKFYDTDATGHDITPLQLRQKGVAALVQALGAVGMVRFMQQFEAGSGDYTRDSVKLANAALSL